MIRQLVYRIRSYKLKVAVMIAIETGASLSEVHRIKWSDIDFQNRTITIRGVKGHRSYTYSISNELVTLLNLIPKDSDRIFKLKYPDKISGWIEDICYMYQLIVYGLLNLSPSLSAIDHTFMNFIMGNPSSSILAMAFSFIPILISSSFIFSIHPIILIPSGVVAIAIMYGSYFSKP